MNSVKILSFQLSKRSPVSSYFHSLHPDSFNRRLIVVYSTTTKNSSTSKNENKNRINLNNNDKLSELLTALKDVLSSPDMAKVSITRTIQVATAISKISTEFIQNSSKYQGVDGQLSLPKILKRIFEELGATYIKLGQFVASSPTIFPPEYVTEFQSCLDKSPTVDYGIIRKIIESDLNKPIKAIYKSVNPIPIASASIAQVHRAVLLDGTEVVIKVRKPGVDSTLKADLGFLLIASKIIEFISPSVSSLSLSNIVGDIRESMLDELDFRKESKNLENFRSFLVENDIQDAVAPKPYPKASGIKVLTMEYLKGIPLIDLEGIRKYSKSPEATLISALRTWALTVASNDIFHADVHAGNLLVLEDGRIGFIDFGIVGKISDNFRNNIAKLFESFIQDDYKGVAEALVKLGATSSNVNIDKFGQELAVVVKKITSLQPEITLQTTDFGQTIDAQLSIDERETTAIVLEIVGVSERNGLKLPREFGLILKQALYFDRYQKLLAPSMDPLRDARLRSSFTDEIFSNPSSNNKKINKIIDVEVVDNNENDNKNKR
eukprot:gene4722-6627_t